MQPNFDHTHFNSSAQTHSFTWLQESGSGQQLDPLTALLIFGWVGVQLSIAGMTYYKYNKDPFTQTLNDWQFEDAKL